jgi:hypothetical protein
MEMTTFPEYTEEQLKVALDGLLEGSSDPAFDGRHLFGTADPNHKLSKLQTVVSSLGLGYVPSDVVESSVVFLTLLCAPPYATFEDCYENYRLSNIPGKWGLELYYNITRK